jgi:acyl-CoA synthetase (AMP-forming)/AMP-acid ligase II
MIISGGINIFPREIEEVLFSHPKVADAAVIGKRDNEWGEIVKAFVVLKKGEVATEKDIIDYAKTKLASYKKPKEVQFMEVLPKSTTGKTLKRVLKDKYS